MEEFVVVRDEEENRTVYVKEAVDDAADMHEAFELYPDADRYEVTVLHGKSWDEVTRVYPHYADGKPS